MILTLDSLRKFCPIPLVCPEMYTNWGSRGIILVRRQNVPGDNTSQGQNVPRDTTSLGTKRPTDKTSHGQNVQRTKCPKMSQGTNLPTYTNYQAFKNTFCVRNGPQMLGNGPHPCILFITGLFLFWGG